MKTRTSTQTAGGNEESSYIFNSLIPICSSIQIVGSNITVQTHHLRTRISLNNYVEFRFYKWWSIMNYRVIIRWKDSYRILDFRGKGECKSPDFFEQLGYDVKRIDNFWRRSSEIDDSEKYGIDLTCG